MFDFIQIERGDTVPSGTIGIEVTDVGLARQCAVNIDGQHGMGGPFEWTGKAAIEIATEVTLPPDGATLATVRPDLDAIGAMAVIVLRAVGTVPDSHGGHARRRYVRHFTDHGAAPDGDFAARIAAVAVADSFRPAAAWVPTPLPTPEQPWPTGAGAVDSTPGLAHVAAICSPRPGQAALPLAERVAIVACWLLWGDPHADDGPWGDDAVEAEVRAACGVTGDACSVRAQLCRAHGTVEASRRALAAEAQRLGAVESAYGVAVVRVAHAGALGLGYCVAPVVVAFDQAITGKATVAAYGPGYLDVAALKTRLNAAEEAAGGSPTWGGPPLLCASPQVPGGARLSEQAIVAAVRASMSGSAHFALAE